MAPDLVLTAAHCVMPAQLVETPRKMGSLIARLSYFTNSLV